MSIEVQPLCGPPPAEVPLLRAPVARAIAQVRFAPILAIRNPDRVADFQEAIRAIYPNLTEERVPHIAVQVDGTPSYQEAVVWRFSSSIKSLQWRVSLGVDFVALETASYTSRKDFLERFELILRSIEAIYKPSEAHRLGLRYVDRIQGDGFENIHGLIKPGVLGISLPTEGSQTSLGNSIQYMLTEAHLEAEEGIIQARWGHIPPGLSYDPASVDMLDKSSWVIDLDMFSRGPQPFVSAELLVLATKFAERNYSVFRDMVTDDFLKFYGGNL
jgi:uncharacterized protein (TIGR04255 family)